MLVHHAVLNVEVLCVPNVGKYPGGCRTGHRTSTHSNYVLYNTWGLETWLTRLGQGVAQAIT
jgi:hypothetical protein